MKKILVLIVTAALAITVISPLAVQASEEEGSEVLLVPVVLDDKGDPVPVTDQPDPALLVNGQEWKPTADGDYYLTNPTGTDRIAVINGKITGNIYINGKWQLESDLYLEGNIIVESGSFKIKNTNVHADSIYFGYYDDGGEVISGDLGSGNIWITVLSIRGSGVTLKADQADIICTLLFDASEKNGHKFKNVTARQEGTVYAYIEGSNEFENLDIQGNGYIKGNQKVNKEYTAKGQVKSGKKGTMYTVREGEFQSPIAILP